MKSRILILLIACTCMCALSVAGATNHGKVSKNEIVRSMDMPINVDVVMPSNEVVFFTIDARMSVNFDSSAIGVTSHASNQKIVSEYKRWYSTGPDTLTTNRFNYSPPDCTNYPIMYHADA